MSTLTVVNHVAMISFFISILHSLKTRLIESGFDEHIINHIPKHDWRRYPTMGQSKPLTDIGQ